MASLVTPSGRVYQPNFIYLGDEIEQRAKAAGNKPNFVYLGNWTDAPKPQPAKQQKDFGFGDIEMMGRGRSQKAAA
jgi:hypothetical protein